MAAKPRERFGKPTANRVGRIPDEALVVGLVPFKPVPGVVGGKLFQKAEGLWLKTDTCHFAVFPAFGFLALAALGGSALT